MSMVTSGVIHRVFGLRYEANHGTCFSIRENEQEFLITAAHLVNGYDDGKGLEIVLGGKEWGEYKRFYPRRLHLNEAHDIAVFEAPEPTQYPSLPLSSGQEGLVLGQSVQWMGYPLGHDGGLLRRENGAPIGIVSSGNLAALQTPNQAYRNGHRGFLLEGGINLGNSGSPVLFRSKDGAQVSTKVFGVISGTLAPQTTWGLVIAGSLHDVMKKVHNKGR